MASKSEQVKTALQNKKRAESRLITALVPFIGSVVANYRVGDTDINSESTELLSTILRNFYAVTSKDVLKFDYRQYKQVEDEDTFNIDDLIYIPISLYLSSLFADRLITSTKSIKDKNEVTEMFV